MDASDVPANAMAAHSSSVIRLSDPDLERSLAAAMLTLRVLSRVRVVWRNTCLHRSVAQSLVLRKCGRTAVLRIGVRVREGGGPVTDVQAHAWVSYDGPGLVEPPHSGFRELRASRR
jgi:hypothetical protein